MKLLLLLVILMAATAIYAFCMVWVMRGIKHMANNSKESTFPIISGLLIVITLSFYIYYQMQ